MPNPVTSSHPGTAPHNPTPAGRRPARARRAVRAGVVGNYLDQLHIFLPVTALAPALATVAGPHASVGAGAVVVLATLLGRPVGAMVFGRIADRVGRTRTTQVAILGTACATLAVAVVPGFAVLGAGTMAIIVGLRFVGGVFLAGEYSAAIPLSMEWAEPRRRGVVSGLIMSMAPWAQATIAFTTLALLTALGRADYAAWGWRLPFALAGCASLGMAAYYRLRVADAAAPSAQAARLGLGTLLVGALRRPFWQMFGLMSGLWLLTNLTVIQLTGTLTNQRALPAAQVSTTVGIAAVGQAVVMALAGALSTRTGRRRFFLGWGVLAAVAGPLLWSVVTGRTTGTPLVLAAVALQVTTVCAYGPVGAYLSERFTADVRSTGYGTAYSLSIVVPALYPYYLPALQDLLGDRGAVYALLALGGLLVAGCGAAGPRLAPAELDAPLDTVARRVMAR